MGTFFSLAAGLFFVRALPLPLRVKGAPSVNAGARRQPEPLTRKNIFTLSYGEQAALCGLLAMQAGGSVFRVCLFVPWLFSFVVTALAVTTPASL